MDGAVVWEGRTGSTATTYAVGPPQTATFTLSGTTDISTGNSATTDYLVFGDDDPASVTATVTSPVQIGSGPPAPGYYRPTFPKWTWWDVNALSGATVTINTNAYTNPETLPGGGTDPFTGVRGPGVTTSVAIASMARVQHGFLTALSLDLDATEPMATKGTVTDTGGVHEGTLGGQYVTVTTGACANRTYKIAYVDAVTSTTTEPDIIYVVGDLTEECGAAPEIVINYGWRAGDPVKLVRPAYIDGGNAARVDWTGGSIKANWARFENLFPSLPSGNTYNCLICVYRTDATTQPTASGSYMTNIEVAFPNTVVAGTATVALSFDNSDGTGAAYHYGTSALDMTGLVLDRWNIHDQRLEHTGGTQEGVHGIASVLSTGVTATRFRIARLGDDAALYIANNDGNTSQTQNLTLRQFWADEAGSLTNSQQLIDATYPVPGGTESQYSLTLSDVGGNCCTDGGISAKLFNVTADRLVTLGTNGSTGGIVVGGSLAATFTDTPVDSGALNTIRDSFGIMAGPTADYGALGMNANVYSSVFGGNINSANMAISCPYSIAESFFQLGVANAEGYFKRFNLTNSVLGCAATTLRLRDSVFLNARTAGTRQLHLTSDGQNYGAGAGPSFDNDDTATSYDITRSVFGSTVPAGGVCDASCQTAKGIEFGRTLTANGITLATITPSAGGVGMGDTGEGTSGGATISNGCVEVNTSTVPTGVNVFGASRTATSIVTDDNGPDPDDDVPISAWAAKSTTAICGGLARPRQFGIKKFGVTSHGMLGDGFAGNIDLFTTDTRLIRSVTGGGGGRSGPPSIGGR